MFGDRGRATRVQKRAVDPLELKLQALVHWTTWVLGDKLGSSARAVGVPNY